MPSTALASPRTDSLDLDLTPAALAMVWPGVGRAHEALAVPGIRLAHGDALVSVELATVCGSDVHTATGHRPGPVPSVLGHEQVGRVLATAGPVRAVDGRRLEPGMRVIWSVVVSCGRCTRCRRGLSNKCTSAAKYGHEAVHHEWELSGGFASAVHLKRGTGIVIVDDETPAGVLAPASCATATVVAAIEAAEQITPLSGRTVLVTGAGMLGLTATAMAADAGARVIVSDPSAERRAAALRFGAAAVADPTLPSGAAGSLAAGARRADQGARAVRCRAGALRGRARCGIRHRLPRHGWCARARRQCLAECARAVGPGARRAPAADRARRAQLHAGPAAAGRRLPGDGMAPPPVRAAARRGLPARADRCRLRGGACARGPVAGRAHGARRRCARGLPRRHLAHRPVPPARAGLRCASARPSWRPSPPASAWRRARFRTRVPTPHPDRDRTGRRIHPAD